MVYKDAIGVHIIQPTGTRLSTIVIGNKKNFFWLSGKRLSNYRNRNGGYLAVPSDLIEMQYFVTRFNSFGSFWVGVNDQYIGK